MLVVGVDEVGRGALVGDLVVCAVQFSHGVESALEGAGCELLDSKAFTTRRRRERAYDILVNTPGVSWRIARKSPEQIEKIGIHYAVLDAMQEASLALSKGEIDCRYLFDGKFVPADMKAMDSEAIVKGDSKVPQISAASIIAKVERDREMDELGVRHPEYGFENNAGYGTKQHIEAIRSSGLLREHRSWARKFLQDV